MVHARRARSKSMGVKSCEDDLIVKQIAKWMSGCEKSRKRVGDLDKMQLMVIEDVIGGYPKLYELSKLSTN